MNKSYRCLTPAEICSLETHGCTARNWNDLRVPEQWEDYTIQRVHFDGKSYLSNHIHLSDIAMLRCNGATAFGNGTEVGVMKEDGGLEVYIYDQLTSMEAAFCVQEATAEPELVHLLHQKAHDYAASIQSDGNIIDEHVSVSHCLEICNVHLATGTHVMGATRLNEVSVNSTLDAPSGIGANVILDHVIIGTDTHITDGAQLDYCFVGQGCHIGRMYSATQSLFFANCHFENGEACAYFAGPYSVSHHKATLMIACMTSFFNAGSGSNQSNHSYKMGPNKYGYLLRGAKLGSSSYVYWPMQVGVFSTVIMHHTGHQDLRDLPFSLITEGSDGKTHIIPGQAFLSVGTRRDALKWPKRDKRSEAHRNDILNFSLLNPYNIAYIQKGIATLEELLRQGTNDYQGCIISTKHIERGIQLYKDAITRYLGTIAAQPATTPNTQGTGEWADYGGMLVPRTELLETLRNGGSFEDIAQNVDAYEYNWATQRFDMSNQEAIIQAAKEASEAWDAILDADAEQDIKNSKI